MAGFSVQCPCAWQQQQHNQHRHLPPRPIASNSIWVRNLAGYQAQSSHRRDSVAISRKTVVELAERKRHPLQSSFNPRLPKSSDPEWHAPAYRLRTGYSGFSRGYTGSRAWRVLTSTRHVNSYPEGWPCTTSRRSVTVQRSSNSRNSQSASRRRLLPALSVRLGSNNGRIDGDNDGDGDDGGNGSTGALSGPFAKLASLIPPAPSRRTTSGRTVTSTAEKEKAEKDDTNDRSAESGSREKRASVSNGKQQQQQLRKRVPGQEGEQHRQEQKQDRGRQGKEGARQERVGGSGQEAKGDAGNGRLAGSRQKQQQGGTKAGSYQDGVNGGGQKGGVKGVGQEKGAKGAGQEEGAKLGGKKDKSVSGDGLSYQDQLRVLQAQIQGAESKPIAQQQQQEPRKQQQEKQEPQGRQKQQEQQQEQQQQQQQKEQQQAAASSSRRGEGVEQRASNNAQTKKVEGQESNKLGAPETKVRYPWDNEEEQTEGEDKTVGTMVQRGGESVEGKGGGNGRLQDSEGKSSRTTKRGSSELVKGEVIVAEAAAMAAAEASVVTSGKQDAQGKSSRTSKRSSSELVKGEGITAEAADEASNIRSGSNGSENSRGKSSKVRGREVAAEAAAEASAAGSGSSGRDGSGGSSEVGRRKSVSRWEKDSNREAEIETQQQQQPSQPPAQQQQQKQQQKMKQKQGSQNSLSKQGKKSASSTKASVSQSQNSSRSWSRTSRAAKSIASSSSDSDSDSDSGGSDSNEGDSEGEGRARSDSEGSTGDRDWKEAWTSLESEVNCSGGLTNGSSSSQPARKLPPITGEMVLASMQRLAEEKAAAAAAAARRKAQGGNGSGQGNDAAGRKRGEWSMAELDAIEPIVVKAEWGLELERLFEKLQELRSRG